MPAGYTLIVARNRIEVTYDEHAGADDHIGAVHAVIEAMRAHPGLGVLVDSRAPGVVLTSDQEREIAAAVASAAPLFHAGIAILTQPGVQYGMARIQQAVAEAQGIPLTAFTDPDEAIAWLLSQHPRPGDTR